MPISCEIHTCSHNNDGICNMYNEERDDAMRTIEFYTKWNPKMLPPVPKTKREGDM